MIDLKKFGFTKTQTIANRDFYDNGIFKIIEHNGTVYLDREDGNFCSDIEFENDEELAAFMLKLKDNITETIFNLQTKLDNLNDILQKSNHYYDILPDEPDTINK